MPTIKISEEKLDWLIQFLETETDIGEIPEAFSVEEKNEINFQITKIRDLVKILKSKKT